MRQETKLWADYKKYIDKQNKEIGKYNKKLLDEVDDARSKQKDPWERAEQYNKNKKWYQFKQEVNIYSLVPYYKSLSFRDSLLSLCLKSYIKPTTEGFMDWKLEQEKRKKKSRRPLSDNKETIQ